MLPDNFQKWPVEAVKLPDIQQRLIEGGGDSRNHEIGEASKNEEEEEEVKEEGSKRRIHFHFLSFLESHMIRRPQHGELS